MVRCVSAVSHCETAFTRLITRRLRRRVQGLSFLCRTALTRLSVRRLWRLQKRVIKKAVLVYSEIWTFHKGARKGSKTETASFFDFSKLCFERTNVFTAPCTHCFFKLTFSGHGSSTFGAPPPHQTCWMVPGNCIDKTNVCTGRYTLTRGFEIANESIDGETNCIFPSPKSKTSLVRR